MTEQTADLVVINRKSLSEMSVEEMLDLQVNQVEELQELVTVQSFFGDFKVKLCSLEPADGENKGYFAMQVETMSVHEVESANPHSFAPPQVGQTFTERYYPGYGTQRLTTVISHLLGPQATIRDWLEQGEGMEFTCFMAGKKQVNKRDKTERSFNELDVFLMTGPATPVAEG